MGYCAHTMESQLPVMWTEMETTSDTKDLRGTVMAAWGCSRATRGIDPSECYSFYLEDKYVKELKSGDFAPGGAMPVWEYFMRGMGPLVCMNWTTAQLLQTQDEATAYEKHLACTLHGQTHPRYALHTVRYVSKSSN